MRDPQFTYWDLEIGQMEAIRNKDKSAYDKFFTDNYKKLERYISYFYYKQFCKGIINDPKKHDVEDAISQLYIDLKHCDFRSGAFMIYFINLSLRCFNHGGYSYLNNEGRTIADCIWKGFFFDFLSLDAPMPFNRKKDKGKEITISEGVQDNFWDRLEAEQLEANNTEIILKVINKYISGKEFQIFSLYYLGFSQWRVQELIGKSFHLRYLEKAKTTLYKNWDALYNELIDLGFNFYQDVSKLIVEIKEYYEKIEDKKAKAKERDRIAKQRKREADPEAAKAKLRAYEAANREKIRARDRERYEKRKNEINAHARERYAATHQKQHGGEYENTRI